MRTIIKRIASSVLIPLTKWYLRKPRSYTYRGIKVIVMPGVFHPGLFHSTKFLIDYLIGWPLRSRTLLELGCGSGMLAVVMAKRGAVVTATDLSELAVDNTRQNALLNEVDMTIIYSDLMKEIPAQTFDYVIINPPYYPRVANNPAELAWNAGSHFEYFKKLFASLHTLVDEKSNVIMVLTQATDLAAIFAIAKHHGYYFELIDSRWRLFDGKDLLYKIKSG